MPRRSENSFGTFYQALTRKKPLDCRTSTELKRCLNLVDLTALGVGSTLGLGLYVLAGQVAATKAGPAVIISFALAAITSGLSAICYAEFAGRVPKAGSAYAYSYITTGEFVAFIIGWNLILEYVIGAASVARGFSGYLLYIYQKEWSYTNSSSSSLTITNNGTSVITKNMTTSLLAVKSFVGLSGNNQSAAVAQLDQLTHSIDPSTTIPDWLKQMFSNFDWLTLVLILIITCFLLIGVKESTNFTLLFTGVNLLVVLVAVIGGLDSIDLRNWQLKESDHLKDHNGIKSSNFGTGGFMPFGWTGVIAGAATCFFGFIGFDTIASSAEEAKNPKRNVPLAIILSLIISFTAYFSTAVIQTLIWPYYDQDKIAVLPYIFDHLNMPYIYWIVLIGAIAGLTSSQCGSIYPLPRIIYSMSRDSIIYHCLAKVNARLQIPVRATIVGSLFTALLASMLDIQELADMVSIGTLAAYSLVALSVMIIRYENRLVIDDSNDPAKRNRISYPDITSGDRRDTTDDTITSSSIVNPHQTQQNYDNNIKQVASGVTKISSTKNYSATGDATSGKNNELNTTTKTTIASNNEQQTVSEEDNRDAHQHTTTAETTTATTIDPPEHTGRKQSTPIRIKGSQPVVVDCCDFNSSYVDNNNMTNSNSDYNSDTITTTNESTITTSKDDAYLAAYEQISCSKSKGGPHLDGNNKHHSHTSNLYQMELPNGESCDRSKKLLLLTIIVIIMLVIIIQLTISTIIPFSLMTQITIGTLVLILVILTSQISQLPTSKHLDTFQVPLVPWLPLLSIFVNTFLMLNLSYLTWIRFSIWMIVGFFIYFSYGIWHSTGYLLD